MQCEENNLLSKRVDNSELKNKVAIVTGGGKGIGEEISLGLVKEGAKIVIADLDKKNSSNVIKTIIQNGGDAIYVETNVSNEQSVKNLISETVKQFKQIDRVIIGSDNSDHLKQLVNDFSLNIDVNPQYLSVEDTRLIDPFNWKI